MDNNHREGVAIVMTPTAKKSLIETSIIVFYAPTNDAEEEKKNTFYQQLQKAIGKIPTHYVLLIIGDLNAKVGSLNEGREQTIGKHGCGTIKKTSAK